jgi:hypothetical protein
MCRISPGALPACRRNRHDFEDQQRDCVANSCEPYCEGACSHPLAGERQRFRRYHYQQRRGVECHPTAIRRWMGRWEHLNSCLEHRTDYRYSLTHHCILRVHVGSCCDQHFYNLNIRTAPCSPMQSCARILQDQVVWEVAIHRNYKLTCTAANLISCVYLYACINQYPQYSCVAPTSGYMKRSAATPSLRSDEYNLSAATTIMHAGRGFCNANMTHLFSNRSAEL